jgi:tripartite-type tricarboxylate transporter receptor subunit TctC
MADITLDAGRLNMVPYCQPYKGNTMKFPRRQFLKLAGAAAIVPGVFSLTDSATAQSWPNRAIKFVVPFPPGGSADPVARVVGSRLADIWGQPVVIENKAGAGGKLATLVVTQSPPDGYTLFISGDFLARLPFLYSPLGFDPINDLVPVIRLCSYVNVMVVPNSSPAKSVKEFIDYAKANRGRLTFASSGAGASPHLSGELFKLKSGIELTHVPYRGGGPALIDLIAGRVDVMFATAPTVLSQISSGSIRAIAVTSAIRNPLLPTVPTIAESGLPDFEYTNWYALFLPAKTPAEIVKKMYDDAAAALADPQVKQRLADVGVTAAIATGTEVTADLKSEMQKWGPIIKDAGIKAE